MRDLLIVDVCVSGCMFVYVEISVQCISKHILPISRLFVDFSISTIILKRFWNAFDSY